MRKSLLFLIILLSCLSADAQTDNETLVSLAKVNYVGITEFPDWFSWSLFPEEPEDKVEVVDDGIAITNTKLQSKSWQAKVTVVPSGSFVLEEGHDYVVRLTLKVPSDGSYWIYMGDWDVKTVKQVAVKASEDFQIIDVDYPEYQGSVKGGFVILGCGWVPGTTILKEVEVLEKQKGGETAIKPVKKTTPDDTIYNLSGQKVSSSYKGIVIRKGRKIVN